MFLRHYFIVWILRLGEFFTLFIQVTHSILTGGPSLSTTATSQEATHSGADVGSLGRSRLKQDRAALGEEPPSRHTDLSRTCSHLVDILFQLLLPGEVPELLRDRSRHVRKGGSLNWVFPKPLSADQASWQDPTRLSSTNSPALPSLALGSTPPSPQRCRGPLSHQARPFLTTRLSVPRFGPPTALLPPAGWCPPPAGQLHCPCHSSESIYYLITARNGTRIGEGREQRPLTVRGSMAAPTYAGGDGGRELRLLCLLPQLCPAFSFLPLPNSALPLPGPAAPLLPCTLETRGTGVSATQRNLLGKERGHRCSKMVGIYFRKPQVEGTTVTFWSNCPNVLTWPGIRPRFHSQPLLRL